ncbi:MAG: hypothetical protein AABX59_03085 [Nanoarchaeota archaeon]
MTTKIQERVGNFAYSAVYGIVSWVGYEGVKFSMTADKSIRGYSQVDKVKKDIMSIVALPTAPSEEQISRLKLQVTDLKDSGRLDLTDESKLLLEHIVSNIDGMDNMYNPQNVNEQLYVRTALIEISDGLNGLKTHNIDIIKEGAGTGLFLGGAAMLFCGYLALKSFFSGILKK